MSLALVIIDQQKGLSYPKLGSRNNPDAELVMLQLLSCFRNKDLPIYHVKHRSTESDSVFWPGQEGFEFKTEFLPYENEGVTEKSVPCAFIKTDLEQKLQHSNSQKIVVIGASTNNSVESSVRTAANLGIKVTVIEDACFAYEKVDFSGVVRSADEVHSMSLANLEGEYAQVISSAQFLSEI